jgi:DNA-binding response OmpR family regulator
MLHLILKKKGFDCDQSVDGDDAVKVVAMKGLKYYDIIFMDSVMPNMVSTSY